MSAVLNKCIGALRWSYVICQKLNFTAEQKTFYYFFILPMFPHLSNKFPISCLYMQEKTLKAKRLILDYHVNPGHTLIGGWPLRNDGGTKTAWSLEF